MFWALAEVVFEMIALGLEGVVVLVFAFPPGASLRDEGGDVLVGDSEIGDKAIEIGPPCRGGRSPSLRTS